MEKSSDRSNTVWSRVKVLGSGAFGVVELWRNGENGETRAIKKCQLDVSKMSKRQIERWNEEVEFMNRVNHPNIVGTRDIPIEVVDKNTSLPLLCMEYCRKGDLRNVLNRPENLWGLSENEALRFMRDISSAVEYLHGNRITHRDLKPQNIVIQDGKSGTIYKLIDLGYAKELGEASTSASLVGTLNYLAPEIFWKSTYSSSVDYWSLGILFYEILTGIRPFLPNMQVNKNWLTHIQKKGPDDISAREMNGKVEFSKKIDYPSNVSQCLRDDLVPWFRLVFQWDPSTRGKFVENGKTTVVVFKILKKILSKKIIHLFFVSNYKRDNYLIDEMAKILEIQEMIFERENIQISNQLLVTSQGKLLENCEGKILDFLEENDELMVFEREKLLIERPDDFDAPQDIKEMMQEAMKKCHYQTLRRYYEAVVFFMKQQVELYKSYVIALSIKIDLCDTNYENLSQKIDKILSESISLEKKIQDIFPQVSDDSRTPRKLQNFHQLHQKINILVESSRGIKDQLKNILDFKEKWKNIFSTSIGSSGLSDILGKAEEVLRSILGAERNKSGVPKRMLQIYFKFLEVRHEMLSDKMLLEFVGQFLKVEGELLKLERSLRSFKTMLGQYQRDFDDLKGENGGVRRAECSGDVLVRDNIVLGHLISELLAEMRDTKAKLDSLD